MSETFLKIKNKHLAEEARIIRFEEKRTSDSDLRNSLTNHRKRDVRMENRATGLARAYIKGQSYKTIEQSRRKTCDDDFRRIIKRVTAMVSRYHKYGTSATDIIEWTEAR